MALNCRSFLLFDQLVKPSYTHLLFHISPTNPLTRSSHAWAYPLRPLVRPRHRSSTKRSRVALARLLHPLARDKHLLASHQHLIARWIKKKQLSNVVGCIFVLLLTDADVMIETTCNMHWICQCKAGNLKLNLMHKHSTWKQTIGIVTY